MEEQVRKQGGWLVQAFPAALLAAALALSSCSSFAPGAVTAGHIRLEGQRTQTIPTGSTAVRERSAAVTTMVVFTTATTVVSTKEAEAIVTPTPAAAIPNRPLQVPRLAAGQSCPVTAPGRRIDPRVGLAHGSYPVYLVYGDTAAGSSTTLLYGLPTVRTVDWPTTWGAHKFLLAVSNRYSGPLLLRGHQLNGPNALHFSLSAGNAPSLYIPGRLVGPGYTSGYWVNTYELRFRAPGCYGLQIDGTDFSEVIVFKTVPAP
ncbi:MAG: hypothetical protein M1298_02265 [Chloroflexi bacterium]|nr:hypothetical protein [Chloroflexota bacterium]